MIEQTTFLGLRLKSVFLAEVIIKDVTVLYFCYIFFLEDVFKRTAPSESAEGHVLSLLGFLMAAAIIGAFELTYTRTNLRVWYHRYLAHLAKTLILCAVLLLVIIALDTTVTTFIRADHFYESRQQFAVILHIPAGLLVVALFVHDLWDALLAANEQLGNWSRAHVIADSRLADCAEVKVNHLGGEGGLLGRRPVDLGASSKDSDDGPASPIDPTDQSADRPAGPQPDIPPR